MNDWWIGIDPGRRGAIVALSDDLVYALQMPHVRSEPDNDKSTDEIVDAAEVDAWVREVALMTGGTIRGVAIERAQAMPAKDKSGKLRQGIAGMFRYGRNYGQLLAWCQIREWPFVLVAPQTWQRSMFVFEQRYEKQLAVDYCGEHHPKLDLTPRRLRKPHDGISEACVIADWCRTHSPFRKSPC